MNSMSGRAELARLRAMGVDDVITIRQLEAAGVSSGAAYRRCGPGGPWQRILPGVLLMHSGPPTWRQRLRAALVYGGENAMLTGAAAGALHGIRGADPQGEVHLLIPHDIRRRAVGFVRTERSLRVPEPVDRGGFQCAPVVRAVLDHARALRRFKDVEALLTEAVQKRLCTPVELVAELDAGTTRGSALARAALVDVLGGAQSVAEIRAKRVAERSGLPAPLWNVKLYTDSGEFVGNPDAWFDDVGLAWEIDSRDFHADLANYDRTLRRNARYAGFGVPMIPHLPSRLVREEAAVIGELVAAYDSAAKLPRPRLIVVHGTSAA